MSSEEAKGGAGGAAKDAHFGGGVTEEAAAVGMPLWRMPAPMKSPLGFFDTAYPLKLYNSLTRSKVRPRAPEVADVRPHVLGRPSSCPAARPRRARAPLPRRHGSLTPM